MNSGQPISESSIQPSVAHTQKPLWIEHTLQDGRKYWSNTATGQSSWDRPADLASTSVSSQPIPSSTHRPINASSWVERTVAATGRKYWFNTVTQTSVWEMPAEFKELMERQRDPVAVSRERGEEAFFKVLKDCGITSSWKWEETLRAIISHPDYKCLPTLAERKVAFAKYIELSRVQECGERREKYVQGREAFRKLLEKTSEIGENTCWPEARLLLEGKEEWKALEDDRDRRAIFATFLEDLEKQHQVRADYMRRFATILKECPEIIYTTKWRDASPIYSRNLRFVSDPDLQTANPLDLLLVFEDHIKALERQAYGERPKKFEAERRSERLNRRAYKGLLKEMIFNGEITALTKWKQLQPFLKNKLEYENMVGQSGSTPLDLFFDELDLLQQAYESDRTKIVEAVGSETDAEKIKTAIEEAQMGREMGISDMKHVSLYLAELKKKADLEKHELERKLEAELERQEAENKLAEAKLSRRQRSPEDMDREELRRRVEKYKSFLRHLPPPLEILVDTKWEDFKLMIQNVESYKALDKHEGRQKYYFEKVVKHLKRRKLEDGDKANGLEEKEEGEVEESVALEGSERQYDESPHSEKKARSRSHSRHYSRRH